MNVFVLENSCQQVKMAAIAGSNSLGHIIKGTRGKSRQLRESLDRLETNKHLTGVDEALDKGRGALRGMDEAAERTGQSAMVGTAIGANLASVGYVGARRHRRYKEEAESQPNRWLRG